MRFGLVHRALLDTLVALGMLSLVTTGEFERLLSGALLAALALAFLVPPHWQEYPTWKVVGSYSPLGLLALQIVRWAQGASPLALAIEFAAALQILRVATRRGAAHDQQIIALSLLHLVAATVLGAGLAYALCFIGFVLITPPALLLSHLRREVEGNYRQGARDRTGLPVDVPRILRSRRVVSRGFLAFVCCLSIPVFLFTALVFIAFPRVGLSLLQLEPSRPTRMVGFSDQVDLGRIGALHSDPTIAIRVTYPALPPDPPPRIALYLRGTAFDRYENRGWRRSETHRTPIESFGNVFALTRYPNTYYDSSLLIDLEPIDPPVIFLPEHAEALELIPINNQFAGPQPTLQAGPENEIRYGRMDDRRGVRYRVYLEPPGAARTATLSSEERIRHLELPPEFTPKIAELARTWAFSETQPEKIAQKIQHRLRTDYSYDLNGPSGAAPNPLEHFLLVSKRGHCEFYSTAMALMLRSLEIPTRNVTGFAGATYNRFGKFYAVRQGDAHSWVEVWIDSSGWQRFDPTPAVTPPQQTQWSRYAASVREIIEATSQRWNRHVERYDLRQQIELLSGLRGHVTSLRHATKWTRLSYHWLWPLPIILVIWALRHRLKRRVANPKRAEATDPRVDEIVRLYRSLERQLDHLGIGRPPATPPLAHARAVQALGHPVAPQLMDLTQTYLDVRFGGKALNQTALTDYARRVGGLRRIVDARDKYPRDAVSSP